MLLLHARTRTTFLLLGTRCSFSSGIILWYFPSSCGILTIDLYFHRSIQIFGGVGIACLPLGLIFSFIRRPKAVITRSQYIKVLCSSVEGDSCNGLMHMLFFYPISPCHVFMICVVGYIRKLLNWVKRQENWRRQLRHFIRKKEVVQRVENFVRM